MKFTVGPWGDTPGYLLNYAVRQWQERRNKIRTAHIRRRGVTLQRMALHFIACCYLVYVGEKTTFAFKRKFVTTLSNSYTENTTPVAGK